MAGGGRGPVVWESRCCMRSASPAESHGLQRDAAVEAEEGLGEDEGRGI